MSHYKYVIFDLGNVIVDIDFDRCFKYWADQTGSSPESFRLKYTQNEHYSRHETGHLSGEEYCAHINELLGVNMSYEVFLGGWNSLFGPAIVATQKFIENNPQIKFFVYSNSNALHRAVWSVRYKSLLDKFEKIYCSSLIGHRKPGPEGFNHIISDLGLPAQEIVFVDDLLVNVQAAEAVGMGTVLFDQPELAIARLAVLCGV